MHVGGHGAGIQFADFHQRANDLLGGLQGGIHMPEHSHLMGKATTITLDQLLAQ